MKNNEKSSVLIWSCILYSIATSFFIAYSIFKTDIVWLNLSALMFALSALSFILYMYHFERESEPNLAISFISLILVLPTALVLQIFVLLFDVIYWLYGFRKGGDNYD